MGINDQKLIVARFAKKFDALILAEKEHKIAIIIRKYNSKYDFQPTNFQALNDYFFIWIGSIKLVALEYIDIWREAIGINGRVTIYYDSHFLLFNFYTSTFKLLYGVTNETPMERIIEWQTTFKNTMDDWVRVGHSFDEALILATHQRAPSVSSKLQRSLTQARQHISVLKTKYSFIDIRDDTSVFFDPFFYDIYYLELTLRGNAAAAADILRLLILYQHGGVYIDVDTLPSLIAIYGPLSERADYNIQNLVRSEYFLRRRRQLKNRDASSNADLSLHERYLNEQDASIVPHIIDRASQWNGPALPAPKIGAHKDLISLAALETFYEYNNNLLAATKNARLVMIILREIRRRYKFIFKNKFDLGPNDNIPQSHYLYRLSNYRYDTMDAKDNVTLFLTGPILILEVILGVAYEILSLKKSISPLAISYALRLNCISVACCEQTSYTPEHAKSSWM